MKPGKIMARFTFRLPQKRILIWLLAMACSFACALLLYGIRHGMQARLYDQRAVYTWSENGENASQISVFYPYDNQADYDRIRELEYNIRRKTEELAEKEEQKDAADFVTCMSAEGSVELLREDSRQSVKAHAIATHGDFFRFHPVKLLSGNLYSQDALMPDQILIDENLAWQLFGSFEIAGRGVMIGGVRHTIAGVFSVPKRGMIEKQAGIPDNLCFLSLESFCQYLDPKAKKLTGIGTWEIVMPNPVKNFAVNLIREQVKADRETIWVVENSARFEPPALRKNMRDLFARGMQSKPVIYPWWENIAIGYANVFSLLYGIQVAFTVFGTAVGAVLIVNAWRKRTWTFAGIWQNLMDRKYDLESRMRYAHDKWEHF
ncbi:MAG: ABC transporter permease [Lachnospiraceae bacterium]|nr:ABC transporter permease [Lachnospiraceae bacterium]